MKLLYQLIIVFIVGQTAVAQGVLKGVITNEDNEPLSFTTIFVDKLGQGTASNEDGKYLLALPNGSHQLVFQYLGYSPLNKTIVINNINQVLNIQMVPEAIDLQTIEVGTDNEDPAYTIMRRAIAKAKFHTQQIDEYTATSYIKGSGRLKDIPRLFRKRIEKELKENGVDTATAFVQESVNEIHYIRPNQFIEKVISVRKIGEDNDTSPNNFINSSFYHSDINGAISPLSPKAFGYYRFEYLGFFSDRAHTINKIKVTPRSRGDQVFEGIIYIVEDLWSIHSLDLFTYIWGIKFNINQIYEPILENVWLPVNQIFDVTGSFFGFDFVYQYFANVNDYKITLNPDLVFVPEVIDDKLLKAKALAADKEFNSKETKGVIEELSSGKEISRKQLRKLMREYEREELNEARQDTLENVTSISSYEVDSLAFERDSSYWQNVRPIPLSEYEVKGYSAMDSISIATKAEEEAEEGDTLSVSIGSNTGVERNSKTNKFAISDILFGGTYKINKQWRFGLKSILANTHYNTVEGYHFAFNPYLYNRSSGLKWRIDPSVHYSFGRNNWNWKVINRFTVGHSKKPFSVEFDLGRYTSQLDEVHGMDPTVNDLMTFIFEKNFLKPHQKEYGKITLSKKINAKYSVSVSGEYANRTMLFNTSYNKLFDAKKRTFTTNQPWNAEIGPTDFEPYSAAILDVQLTAEPWLKYYLRNGKKRVIDNSSPLITLQYRSGIKGINGSSPEFHQLDLGYKHVFNWGVRGQISLQANAGTFINPKNLGIVEFKHFPTNPTFITRLDPVKSFRLLNPYVLSSQQSYLESHVHYQFRKFLLTQMPLVRLTGIRENIYVNSLETGSSDHYFELGYGINYIFRLFRLEVVTSYQGFKFQDWGIRIGVASNLESLFN